MSKLAHSNDETMAKIAATPVHPLDGVGEIKAAFWAQFEADAASEARVAADEKA